MKTRRKLTRNATGKGVTRGKITKRKVSQSSRRVDPKIVKKHAGTSRSSSEVPEDYLTLKRKYEELLKKVEILEKNANPGAQPNTNSSEIGNNEAQASTFRKPQCEGHSRKESSTEKRSVRSEVSVRVEKLKLDHKKQSQLEELSKARHVVSQQRQLRSGSVASDNDSTVSTVRQNSESKKLRDDRRNRRTERVDFKSICRIVPRTTEPIKKESTLRVRQDLQSKVDFDAVDDFHVLPDSQSEVVSEVVTDTVDSMQDLWRERLPESCPGTPEDSVELTILEQSLVPEERTALSQTRKRSFEDPPVLVYCSEPERSPGVFGLLELENGKKYDFRFRSESRCTVGNLLKTICRVCYRKKIHCCSMFDDGGQLAKLCRTFLPIEKLTESDPLPQTVCLECAGVLQAMDDLAFRCFIVQPYFKPRASYASPDIIAIIDPTDESWRTEINDKVIDKFMDSVPTIFDKVKNRCQVVDMCIETCHICARRGMQCLRIPEDDVLIQKAIETFLPLWPPEDGFSLFLACLECLGILQLMDDLAFRFFNVESCLQQHYKIFKTIKQNPYKDSEEEDSESENEENCTILLQRPSGIFPEFDELEMDEQVAASHVRSLDDVGIDTCSSATVSVVDGTSPIDSDSEAQSNNNLRAVKSTKVTKPNVLDQVIVQKNAEILLVDSDFEAPRKDNASAVENMEIDTSEVPDENCDERNVETLPADSESEAQGSYNANLVKSIDTVASNVPDQSDGKENENQSQAKKKKKVTKKKIQTKTSKQDPVTSNTRPIFTVDHSYAQTNGLKSTSNVEKRNRKEPTFSEKLKELRTKIGEAEEKGAISNGVQNSPRLKSVDIPQKSVNVPEKSVDVPKIPAKPIIGNVSGNNLIESVDCINLPKLQFVMKLWVYPLSFNKKKGKITTADLTKIKNGNQTLQRTILNQWIIDFDYEVYYSSVEGILIPHNFKIFPGDHSELSKTFMLQTVQDLLQSEKAQLLTNLDTHSTNPLFDALSSGTVTSMNTLILQDRIQCSHCESTVSKTKVMDHFTEKHLIKCDICNKSAVSPDSLFVHQVKVHGIPYKDCNICGRKLKEGAFCQHRLKCRLCEKTTRQFETLLKHEETHFQSISNLSKMFIDLYSLPQEILDKFRLGKSSPDDSCQVCGKEKEDRLSAEECGHTFLCNDCGDLFYNHPLFLRHKCSSAGNTSIALSKSLEKCLPRLYLNCPICTNFTSQDEYRYQQHFAVCFSNLVSKSFALKSAKGNPMSETDFRLHPVRCQLCNVASPTLISFCKHFLKCVEEQMFFCDTCSDLVPVLNAEDHNCEPKDLINNLHNFAVTKKEINVDITPLYVCYICNAAFTKTTLLILHFKSAHSSQERCCPVCRIVFQSPFVGSLVHHMYQHPVDFMKRVTKGITEKTDFECPLCSSYFNTQLDKIMHDMYHHEKSILICQCREKFLTAESLNNHRIVCSQKKTWLCAVCTETFSTLNSLQDHAVGHFRATTCQWCKIVFKSRSALGAHLRNAHAEKSFSCTICSKSFFFADSLTRHYKARHSKNIYCCASCYKTFDSEGSLSIHSVEHGLNDCYCNFCTRRRSNPRVLLNSCDACCKTFDRPMDLYNHNKTCHSQKFRYDCSICKEIFSCGIPYRRHCISCTAEAQREEANETGPFLCENCGECFSNKDDLFKHYPTCTNSSELLESIQDRSKAEAEATSEVGNENTTACPLCNKSFKSLNFSTFLRHIQGHDAIQIMEVTIGFSKGPLKCPMEGCPKRFTSKIVRMIHDIYHHDKSLYQCKVCSAQFDSYTGWKSHENRCANEYLKYHKTIIESKPIEDHIFRCKLCPETFSSRALLVTHTNKIHCKSFVECDICHKQYSCIDYLNSHKRNVHSDQNFLCPQCGRSFTARKYFLDHMRIHKDVDSYKQFRCSICDAQLFSKSGFANHMQAHSKGEGYPCNQCPCLFIRKSDLKFHMKKQHHGSGLNYHPHHIPRPFPVSKREKNSKVFVNYCKICKCYFNSYADMRAHCEPPIDSGTYRCDFKDCGLAYSNECSLNFHSRYHQDGNKCELCGKSFTYLKVHRLHLQLEHNEIFPFHCKHCNRGFILQNFLTVHNKECNSSLLAKDKVTVGSSGKSRRRKKGEFVSCDHCEKAFVNGADLSIHFVTEHKDFVTSDPLGYTCRICGSSHSCHLSLINHTRFHYRNQEMPGTFCCPICGLVDTKLTTMISHECQGATSNNQSKIQSSRDKITNPKSTARISKKTKKDLTFENNSYFDSLLNSPSSSLEIDSAVDCIIRESQVLSPSLDSVQFIDGADTENAMIDEEEETTPLIENEKAVVSELCVTGVDSEVEYRNVIPDSTTDLTPEMIDPNSGIIYLCSFCQSTHESITALQSHLKTDHDLSLEDLAFQIIS